jgi:hypothetical protein
MKDILIVLAIIGITIHFLNGHFYIRSLYTNNFKNIRKVLQKNSTLLDEHPSLLAKFQHYEKRIQTFFHASVFFLTYWIYIVIYLVTFHIPDPEPQYQFFITSFIFSTWFLIVYNIPQFFAQYVNKIYPNIYNIIKTKHEKSHEKTTLSS